MSEAQVAHVHLPDGILSIEWVAVYWLIALSILGIIILHFRRSKKALDVRVLAYAGAATALAFVVFQAEVPILGGVHLNFTPMLGILAGPVIGSVSALIINILSSSLGHGGWGPIGLNFLINIVEIAIGFAVFAVIFRRLHVNIFASALVATLTALTISNILMIGALFTSGVQGAVGSEYSAVNLYLIAGVNEIVAIIESAITAFLLSFILKVKPELVGGVKVEKS
jgi:cobalt/nickel transport system permease protein